VAGKKERKKKSNEVISLQSSGQGGKSQNLLQKTLKITLVKSD
jgi:hypothetical protein